MDADAAYARIKRTTRRVVAWSRLGIFLGLCGMIGSRWITGMAEAFFVFFLGCIVGTFAFAIGMMANISLMDYARDKAWRERKRESDTWL